METVNVKKHFEEEAKEYDEKFLKVIPFYQKLTDTLVEAVHFEKDKNMKVLDLGCGTGTISKKILERFPKASLHCIDIAENMIEMAKAKLLNFENITFETGNFLSADFSGKFDLILSSLAIHHLNDSEKETFYNKIYDLLNEGGCFYNADIVLAETQYLCTLNLNNWAQYMKKSIPADEVDNKWMPNHEKSDSPGKLMSQISWLKNIGFKDVDVVWKYYNFAVFGGIK